MAEAPSVGVEDVWEQKKKTRMNEAERERIADHVVPMFEAFLEGRSRHVLSGSKQELESQLSNLTRFLLNSYKEAGSGPASS